MLAKNCLIESFACNRLLNLHDKGKLSCQRGKIKSTNALYFPMYPFGAFMSAQVCQRRLCRQKKNVRP